MELSLPEGIKGHIDEITQGVYRFEQVVKDLEDRAAAAKPKADEADAIDKKIMERRAELVELESKLAEVKAAHAAFAKLVAS